MRFEKRFDLTPVGRGEILSYNLITSKNTSENYVRILVMNVSSLTRVLYTHASPLIEFWRFA